MKRFQNESQSLMSKLSVNKATLGAIGVVVLSTASQAASITAPDFSESVTNIGVLLGAMVGFGAVVWGARKLLGFAS